MRVVLAGLFPDLMKEALALYIAEETDLTEEEAIRAVAGFVEMCADPDANQYLTLHPRDPMTFLVHVTEMGAMGYVEDDEGRHLAVLTGKEAPAEPKPPPAPQEEIDALIDETLHRIESLDLRHAWGVLARLQKTKLAGPWTEQEYPAAVVWQRVDRFGDAAAKVSFWKNKDTDPIEAKVTDVEPNRDDVFPRAWTKLGPMPSLSVGMMFVDKELRDRGYLLVPNDPGTL